MPIKSFRGLMASGTQDTIVVHTNTGSTGYRIKKFQIMPHVPGDNNDQELICMIWKVAQSTTALGDNTTTRPDFSNNTLLGCAFAVNDTAAHLNYNEVTVFDNEIFNQDIYITFRDIGGATQPCNYYLELEQFKLDLNENTVATLKDIRNIQSQ
jgi:hypothetical protein